MFHHNQSAVEVYCSCNPDKKFFVNACSLKSGKVRSCGCLQREGNPNKRKNHDVNYIRDEPNIINYVAGYRYGQLEILEILPGGHNKRFKIKCHQCGSEFTLWRSAFVVRKSEVCRNCSCK